MTSRYDSLVTCRYDSLGSCVDMTHLAREKAKADAEYYKAERQAEAYKVRLRGTNLSLHSRLLSLLVSI